MFNKLGIQFVHNGMNAFSGALNTVGKALINYARDAEKAAKANYDSAKAADKVAISYRDKLEKTIESLVKTSIRYSNQMTNIKVGLAEETRAQAASITQSKNYLKTVDQIVNLTTKRDEVLTKLNAKESTTYNQRTSLMSQLNKYENEIADVTTKFLEQASATTSDETAQRALYQAIEKMIPLSVKQVQAIEGAVDASKELAGANTKVAETGEKVAEQKDAWSNLGEQTKKTVQGFTLVRAASGDLTAILTTVTTGVTMLFDIFGKLLGTIGKVALAIGKTLFNALKSIISIPINIAKKLFDVFIGSLQRIFEIVVGMNLSRIIWGLGMRLRELADEAYNAAVEFQFLQIRLKGLITKEMIDSGYELSDAIVASSGRAEELVTWVSKLAVLSPFKASTINDTLALAMSYKFTSEEAQKLTESILDFSTGMGLSDVHMSRIIENFGQMRQQGKISGTELRDLARGAFVPVTEILERMGVNLELISGIKIPSLNVITEQLYNARRAGTLSNDALENFMEGLKGVSYGSSVSANGLMKLYTDGSLTKEILDALGMSAKDLETATSDVSFDKMKAELNSLVAEGKISVDEFFWAFTDMVGEDFPNATEKASASMKVVRQNISDFIETMIGWRVIGPILDVVAKKASGLLATLMGDKALNFFNSLGGALQFVTKFAFNFSDALFNVTSMAGPFSRGIELATSVLGVFAGIGSEDGHKFWKSLDKLNVFIEGAGMENVNKMKWGFIDLRDAFNNIGNVSPEETLQAMTDSLEKIWEPLKAYLKPKVDKLMLDIKTAVVDFWNEKIKPELENYLREVVLPGLATFITETIPSWVAALATNVPAIVTFLTTGLGNALTGLSDWADKNTGSGSALSLTLDLLESITKFIGMSFGTDSKKSGGDAFGTGFETPVFGPFEDEGNNFKNSGLQQSLTDIGNAAKEAGEKLKTFVADAMQPFIDVMDKSDSAIKFMDSFISFGKTTMFDTLAEILKTIAELIKIIVPETVGQTNPFDLENGAIYKFFAAIFSFWDWAVNQFLVKPLQVLQGVFRFIDTAIESIGSTESAAEALGAVKGETAVMRVIRGFKENWDYMTETLDGINNLENTGKITPFQSLKEKIKELQSMETEIGDIGNTETARPMFEKQMEDSVANVQNGADEIFYTSIIPDLVEDIEKYFTDNTDDMIKPFLTGFEELPDKIDDIDMYQPGIDLLQGLLDGMKVKFDEILIWWEITALPKLLEIFNTLYSVNSPSRVWRDKGEEAMAGLEIGLLKGIDGIGRSFSNSLTGLGGYSQPSQVANSNYNYQSEDNRNIIINIGNSQGSFAMDYDYVRAITT